MEGGVCARVVTLEMDSLRYWVLKGRVVYMENGKGVNITRAGDRSSRGTCASRNVTGALKEQLRGAAKSGEDELEQVYSEFRLVAIHEGKWRGDALLQDENRERRT